MAAPRANPEQDAATGAPVAADPGGAVRTVDFRLLGPLEFLIDGVPQAMPGGKPKGLLAVLLINRNRVVPSDSIADAIWDGAIPAAYQGILQVYVSTLRRSLRAAGADGQAVVTTQTPGYKLGLDDACVDLGRFTRWVATGHELVRAGRHAEAASRLRAALAEWSGPALADLRGLRFADAFAAAVQEDRLLAQHACIDAELACGNDSAVIGELRGLTAEHPLREPFWLQLITALYRAGRQADALDAGRRIRELLGDELGIDPSPRSANWKARSAAGVTGTHSRPRNGPAVTPTAPGHAADGQ